MDYYFTELLPNEFYNKIELITIYLLRVPMFIANDFSKLINNDNFCSKFPHLKRMRKTVDPNFLDNVGALNNSKNALVEILIGEAPKISSEAEKFLQENDVKLIWNKLDLPKTPPLSREQHNKLSNTWPLTFLKPKWNTQILSMVEQEEANKFIRLAVKIGYDAGLKGNPSRGCVITLGNKIVALGEDSRISSYPWMHSVMSAVSNFSKRLLKSKYKHDRSKKKSIIPKENNNFNNLDHVSVYEVISDSDLEDQYLCTNCNVYLSHEPCISCSMALVHSRVSKVFYLNEDLERGFLGSNYKLHCIPELNHHYKVFRAVSDNVNNGAKLSLETFEK